MPRGPKLPWMLVQSPASFLGSRLHSATTLSPLRPLGGQVVDHAHEADADDADSYHGGESLPTDVNYQKGFEPVPFDALDSLARR